jgi:hypothetical protein
VASLPLLPQDAIALDIRSRVFSKISSSLAIEALPMTAKDRQGAALLRARAVSCGLGIKQKCKSIHGYNIKDHTRDDADRGPLRQGL